MKATALVHSSAMTLCLLAGLQIAAVGPAVAVNTEARGEHDLLFDVEPWLGVKSDPLDVRIFDPQGRLTEHKQQKSPRFTIRTPELDQWSLCVIEVVPPGT